MEITLLTEVNLQLTAIQSSRRQAVVMIPETMP